MKIILENKKICEIASDFEVIFFEKKDFNNLGENLEELKFLGFKAEGACLLVHKKILYVALEKLCFEEFRIASSKAYDILKKLKIKNFKFKPLINKCEKMSIQSFVEGFVLGSYEFDKYKSDKQKTELENIIICIDGIDKTSADLGSREGKIIADATNFTKDIVNEIPEIYTPIKMADDAQKLASEFNTLDAKIYDENFLKEQNMNAFLAVNRASVHPPRLIHLTYTPKIKSKKRVVFVGKGLTYDSGGLSLKPADYMLTMKADKSGAAACLGIMKAACELELPFEIHAILGATENMIGGNAYKPDDVLISRSGVSIEVQNTDAEGRLVLADCLSYAQDLKPDILIDMATLTGACVVGLGEYTSGLMGNCNELRNDYLNRIKYSGELVTMLDFNRHLSTLIKSDIADIKNVSSSRYGGSITAGLFLDKFIKDEYKNIWMHQDIAGPAYVSKAWGYNQAGASGAGVRMNIYYLNSLAKDN